MAVADFKGNVDPYYRSLIQFLPSGQADHQHKRNEKSNSGDIEDGERKILGEEAKTFYENLLGENNKSSSPSVSLDREKQDHSCKTNRSKNKRKKRHSGKLKSEKNPTTSQSIEVEDDNLNKEEFFQSPALDSNHRQHFKLLQGAQFGNDKDIQDLLKSGLNVNFQDFYGWTPLMCAANEGHRNIVILLLESGACKSLCNTAGVNASSLARNAGHPELADLIDQFKKRKKTVDRRSSNESPSTEQVEIFYCEICKLEFPVKEQKSHFTSTVHLFNSGKKTTGPAYLIPENNRGFQMLLRSGWQADRGLGPDGKGVKYPVKTVLKHDRKGFGGDEDSKKKARITHFNAKDERSIQRAETFSKRTLSVRTIAKNAQKRKEKRDKRWEKNLRFEFS